MGLINFNWLLGSINRVESVCYTMYYVGCIRGYLNLYHTKTYITYHIVIMIFIILFVFVLYYGIGRSFFIIIFIIEFYHLSEFEATNSSWDEPWSLSQSLSCFPIMIVGRCSKLCRINTALLTKGSARPCSVGEWEVAWVKVQDSGNMLGLWAVWLLANECIGYFAKPTCVSYKLLCSFYAEDRLQTYSPTLPFPLSFSCFLPYCVLCSFVLILCMPEHCDQCNTQ